MRELRSHDAQEESCLSRPRKAGAKFTGKGIEADEVIEDVQLGYDARRDRWNGYDVVDKYKVEVELRKKVKEAEDGDKVG
jgi:hypothetical protein